MLKPEQIDVIINKFSDSLDFVQKRLLERLKRLILSDVSDTELVQLFAELDFNEQLINAGYESKVTGFIAEYYRIAQSVVDEARKKGLDKIAGVGINHLDDIIRLDGDALLRRGAMYADQLKSAIMKALITGQSRQIIANEVLPAIQQTVEFNPSWLKTAINQSFTAFQNVAIQAAFESAPESRFELIHIFDKDTRPLCKHAMARMKEFPDGLTIDEINNGKLYEGYQKRYPSEPDNYDFNNRGGFNCRGYWKIKEVQI